MSKLRIMSEFLRFLWQERKFWLIPLVLLLALLSALILFAQSSALTPFLYPFY